MYQKPFNTIRAFARSGHPSDEMGRAGEEIYATWKHIVGGEGEQELHVVLMLGCVSAALEYGMRAPGVADTGRWVQEHMAGFRRRADAGDEAFQGLVESIQAKQPSFGVESSEETVSYTHLTLPTKRIV